MTLRVSSLLLLLTVGCASPPPPPPEDPVGRPPAAAAPEERDPRIVIESVEPELPRSTEEPARHRNDPTGRLSRKRITIDVREADVRDVLRMLAEEGNFNLVVDDEVSGTVTLRLRNVPLEEVFHTVLESQELGYERRGEIFLVPGE